MVMDCILYPCTREALHTNLGIPQYDVEPPPSRSTHEICEQNNCYAVFRFTATLAVLPYPIFRHKSR
jgi:hypothetical protein